MRVGKLTHEMQTFVVQRLACFEDPTTVAAAVAVEFNVEITRQAVEGYDPTKRAGRTCHRSGARSSRRPAWLSSTTVLRSGSLKKLFGFGRSSASWRRPTQQETCSLWQNCSS